MYEYAEVIDGQIRSVRGFPTVLDPAGIRKLGGQLFVVHPDQSQTEITPDDLPRVVASYRVRVIDGYLTLDGQRVTELPEDILVGEVIKVGGIPALWPVRDDKPAFDSTTEELVAGPMTLGDGEVVRTFTKQVRRWFVSKEILIERLIAAGKAQAIITALGADATRRLRWEVLQRVRNDNPLVLQLLTAVSADPAVILAPEE